MSLLFLQNTVTSPNSTTGEGIGSGVNGVMGVPATWGWNFVNTPSIPPGMTFTRASSGTYIDSLGNMQTAGNDTPRFTYDANGVGLGYLSELSSTNVVPNSTMVGAIAGTPGTSPTGWATAIVVQTSIALNTVNNISCIDYTLSNAAAQTNAGLNIATGVTAATGEIWTGSGYIAIVGGDMTNVSTLAMEVLIRNSGGTIVASNLVTLISAGANLLRYIVPIVTGPSDAANISLRLRYTTTAAYNFTVRVGAPQLEKLGTATSFIATSTAAVTRAGDSLSGLLSAVIPSFNQNAGGLTVSCIPNNSNSGTTGRVLVLDDNTNLNYLGFLCSTTNVINFNCLVANVSQAAIGGVISAQAKAAVSFAAADFRYYENGGARTPVASGTLPAMSYIRIGSATFSAQYTGTISSVAYYNNVLSNSALQAFST